MGPRIFLWERELPYLGFSLAWIVPSSYVSQLTYLTQLLTQYTHLNMVG